MWKVDEAHNPKREFVTSQRAPTPKSEFKLGYRPELDGLRGISILFVLFLHLTPELMPGGYLGVDIFFVLSGFLITSLLLQEWARQGSISLKDFYFRRALRLGPALVAYLLLLGVYAFFFLKREYAAEIYTGILLTLSYVSNWVLALKPDYPIGILAITWSLAVEEQFYLLWPLILLILLKRVRWRWIIFAVVLGLVVLTVHRSLLWKTGASFRRLYYATDTRADGLMLGCLVGCLVSWGLLPKSRFFDFGLKSLALVSALFLTYVVLTIKSSNPILFQGVLALAALAIAIIITVVVVWPESRGIKILRFRPLVWVGRISYGLYLWHWPVRGFVFKSAAPPSTRQIVTAAILSFAIASLSFYFVERPFLLWKKRFTHA